VGMGQRRSQATQPGSRWRWCQRPRTTSC
jgi:hypothetical protein